MMGLRMIFIVALAGVVGAAFAAAASQEATVEKGKALFNDPRLGTNGKSCNTCHPGGKGLEKSGSRDDLADVINGCITVSLKGNAVDVNSWEMRSLILYIKSIGNKQPSGKKPGLGW